MTVYDCGELISKAAQVIEHQSVQNVNDINLGITQFISDNNKMCQCKYCHCLGETHNLQRISEDIT